LHFSLAISQPHAVPGVPGEVECDQPALFGAPGDTGWWISGMPTQPGLGMDLDPAKIEDQSRSKADRSPPRGLPVFGEQRLRRRRVPSILEVARAGVTSEAMTRSRPMVPWLLSAVKRSRRQIAACGIANGAQHGERQAVHGGARGPHHSPDLWRRRRSRSTGGVCRGSHGNRVPAQEEMWRRPRRAVR